MPHITPAARAVLLDALLGATLAGREAAAQTDAPQPQEPRPAEAAPIFEVAEQMPELAIVPSPVRCPGAARADSVEGRVFARFAVTEE